MIHFPWCSRRLSIGVFSAILGSGFASTAFCQSPMPRLGDKHFCEWWQARIGPASDPAAQHLHPSKKAAASANGDTDPAFDAYDTDAPTDPDRVRDLNDATILGAISCLLQLEGDTRPANFMGITWAGVSQVFDWAPMNLAALYYVSYLFTCNWKHGNAIALRGPGAEAPESKLKYRTAPWAIYKSYGSYRQWYEQVKAMGLNRARAENLDPLAGTGLYWY